MNERVTDEAHLSPSTHHAVGGVKCSSVFIKDLTEKKKHCMINNNKRRSRRWKHFVHLRISVFLSSFTSSPLSSLPRHPPGSPLEMPPLCSTYPSLSGAAKRPILSSHFSCKRSRERMATRKRNPKGQRSPGDAKLSTHH